MDKDNPKPTVGAAWGCGINKATRVSFDVSRIQVIDDNKMMRVYLKRCLLCLPPPLSGCS